MDQHTSTDSDALLSLLQQIKEHYQEPPPAPRKRGKQRDFSALSFLLLAVVAITLRTFRGSELRKLLEQDAGLRRALSLFARPASHLYRTAADGAGPGSRRTDCRARPTDSV